jgi:hypothetical protein
MAEAALGEILREAVVIDPTAGLEAVDGRDRRLRRVAPAFQAALQLDT